MMIYNLIVTKRKIFRYKGIRVNSFGIPVSNFSKSKKISDSKKVKHLYNPSFRSPFDSNSQKNLIVMYDIPESNKKERDWFRRHLVKFGYEMVQKSVWVGPSPLPKDFLDYLKEIKIGDNFKTFKLARSYDSSISAMA